MPIKQPKNQIKPIKPFVYALAIFCLPILLWPMAILISSEFKNSYTYNVDIFSSIFMWVYPLILFISSMLLYRLYKNNHKLATIILTISFIIFYLIIIAIFYIRM